MKLKMYSVNNISTRFSPKVSNRLLSLFSSSLNEEIELINSVQLNAEIKHLIFNLTDVLYSGTQKNGISKEIPFTQVINVFVSSNHVYIENKGSGYIEVIKDFFYKKYDFSFKDLLIDNPFISKLNKILGIRILDIYFVDSYQDKLGEMELLNEYNLNDLPKDVLINSITFQPLKISDSYITLRRNGEMNLNFDNIEEFNSWLLFFDKEISYNA